MAIVVALLFHTRRTTPLASSGVVTAFALLVPINLAFRKAAMVALVRLHHIRCTILFAISEAVMVKVVAMTSIVLALGEVVTI